MANGYAGELARIRAEYARRKTSGVGARYTFFDPGNLWMIQSRERHVLAALRRAGFAALAEVRALDVGCGEGGELRNLIRWGAQPANLTGIDLLEDRIARARELTPNVAFLTGSADRLQFEDERFDLVTQFTVFTSILDATLKQRIAAEMMRVVKRDGLILWYDLRVASPLNRAVRAIGRREVERLFAGCACRFETLTVAPPLARRLVPYARLVCDLLEQLPPLCTHYLVSIRVGGYGVLGTRGEAGNDAVRARAARHLPFV